MKQSRRSFAATCLLVLGSQWRLDVLRDSVQGLIGFGSAVKGNVVSEQMKSASRGLCDLHWNAQKHWQFLLESDIDCGKQTVTQATVRIARLKAEKTTTCLVNSF